MKPITDHEVIVHGVEHEQYFQGCGVSFTSFADVATGIGGDAHEAFLDALEILADSWDVGDAEQWDDAPSATDCQLDDEDHDELHVYVSVRVK